MIREVVILGSNNTVALALTEDGGVLDLDAVIRITLKMGDTLVDSSVNPEAFDWRTDTKRLVLALGQLDLKPEVYTPTIKIYSADNPLGLDWRARDGGFLLQLRVLEE